MRRLHLGTLFSILLLGSGPGAGATTTETYKDIIDKAQALSLQKERGHAVQLLISSIDRESKKGPPPKELVQALEDVASMFLSEKAQQLYELAISLRVNDPGTSLQKQNEAARLEADNLHIQLEQFRLHLTLGNCNEGATVAERLFTQMPVLDAVKLAAAQGALCRGRAAEAQKIRGQADLKKSGLTIFWNLVDAETQLKLGNMARVNEALTSNEKLDKAFPETQYWRWRLARDSNKNPDTAAERYVAGCKSLSPRAARGYIYEAFLCRRVAEVETSLKKNNNAQP